MRCERRRGLTLIEILIVVLLIGVFVPSTLASLSRQAQKQGSALNRELATVLASEGVELLLMGGFYHFYPLLRPGTAAGAGAGGSGPYGRETYPALEIPPLAESTDITLTIRAFGQISDDPFNPFIGDVAYAPTPPIPMNAKPWTKFRREYELFSKGTSSTDVVNRSAARIIQATVRVYYGPNSEDVVAVPVILGNHRPTHVDLAQVSPNPTHEYRNLRGLLWPNATSLTQFQNLTAEPSDEDVEDNSSPDLRTEWGRPPEGSAQFDRRSLLDSSYPAPTGDGYPVTY